MLSSGKECFFFAALYLCYYTCMPYCTGGYQKEENHEGGDKTIGNWHIYQNIFYVTGFTGPPRPLLKTQLYLWHNIVRVSSNCVGMRLQDSDERSPEDVLSPAQSPEPSPGAASGAGPSLAEKESASAPPKKKKEGGRGRTVPHGTEDGSTYKANRVHGSTTTSTRWQCCVWHGGGRIFTVDVSGSEG